MFQKPTEPVLDIARNLVRYANLHYSARRLREHGKEDDAKKALKSSTHLLRWNPERIPGFEEGDDINKILIPYGFVHAEEQGFKGNSFFLMQLEDSGELKDFNYQWFIGNTDNPELTIEPYSNISDSMFGSHFFALGNKAFGNRTSIAREMKKDVKRFVAQGTALTSGSFKDIMRIRGLQKKFNTARREGSTDLEARAAELATQEILKLKLVYEYPYLISGNSQRNYFRALLEQLTNYFSFEILAQYASSDETAKQEALERFIKILQKKGYDEKFLMFSPDAKKRLQETAKESRTEACLEAKAQEN